jgi:aspartate aminotransferase-like enzyme
LATGKYDLVTITHNETATGVSCPIEEISEVMKRYPDVIWCVDTVSSMGGVRIEVDQLGIDLCITSSQKCLGLPPGMAVCSISEKAVEAAKQVPNRGFYFDLLALYKYIKTKDYQYPSTPSLSHMFAMDYQLDRILEEGLENRYRRHKEMADYVRGWAKDEFALFADERYASNTVTAISNTRGIDIGDLNKRLGEYGYVISNGYGILKDKTFRIAHMADTTMEDVKALIGTINHILK